MCVSVHGRMRALVIGCVCVCVCVRACVHVYHHQHHHHNLGAYFGREIRIHIHICFSLLSQAGAILGAYFGREIRIAIVGPRWPPKAFQRPAHETPDAMCVHVCACVVCAFVCVRVHMCAYVCVCVNT